MFLNKMNIKRVLFSSIFLLMLAFSTNSFANIIYEFDESCTDDDIQLYYTHILSSRCTLDIENGYASAYSLVKGKSNTSKTSIIMKLQQYKNNQWITVTSWKATGTSSCSLNKSYKVPSGYSYRTYSTVTANSETLNIKSKVKNY